MPLIVTFHKDLYSTVLPARTNHRFDRIGNQIPQDDFDLQPVDEEWR